MRSSTYIALCFRKCTTSTSFFVTPSPVISVCQISRGYWQLYAISPSYQSLIITMTLGVPFYPSGHLPCSKVYNNSLILGTIFQHVEMKSDLVSCMVTSTHGFETAIKLVYEQVDEDVFSGLPARYCAPVSLLTTSSPEDFRPHDRFHNYSPS